MNRVEMWHCEFFPISLCLCLVFVYFYALKSTSALTVNKKMLLQLETDVD